MAVPDSSKRTGRNLMPCIGSVQPNAGSMKIPRAAAGSQLSSAIRRLVGRSCTFMTLVIDRTEG